MMNVGMIRTFQSFSGATNNIRLQWLVGEQRRAFTSALFSVSHNSIVSCNGPSESQDPRVHNLPSSTIVTSLEFNRRRNPLWIFSTRNMSTATATRGRKASLATTDHPIKPPQHDSNADESDKDSVVLYERDPETNNFPRAMLGVAYFSSFYWTWYAFDFIPTVNNSPIEMMHIKPWWGAAACTFAYAINIVAAVYCKAMVSKVVLQADAAKPVHIYRHSLPFMIQSSKSLEYGYGKVSLDYNASEVQNLMSIISTSRSKQQLPSVSLSDHVALKVKDRKFPMVLFLKTTDDIKNKDLFLDTLLFASVDLEDEAECKVKSTEDGTPEGTPVENVGIKQKPKAGGKLPKRKAKSRRRR